MRISDWSSDVCSSDLIHVERGVVAREPPVRRRQIRLNLGRCGIVQIAGQHLVLLGAHHAVLVRGPRGRAAMLQAPTVITRLLTFRRRRNMRPDRKSTRLNQSLMRTPYAVFCWKKKKQR